MLSFDYHTHAVETKRGNCNVQDKKLAETNYKTSEVGKKRKLNTISWNLRLILSLRDQRNYNVM